MWIQGTIQHQREKQRELDINCPQISIPIQRFGSQTYQETFFNNRLVATQENQS
ncbi:unnamed protein product [Paramecium pentaurelia]|uniref:Uncharacterized protein n=1 Tax=Paramecium pentaurelia TaxID=43138 RepID=A0A8S1YKD4_9CILI|nr:unnamed protein product [Paramecium pentaurelia]